MTTATASADIRKLTEAEFEAFRPARGPLGELIGEEKEWYADRRGNVIGVLVLDRIDKDWSYVVLGRDARGKFRAIDAQVSFQSPEQARTELVSKLRRLARTRKKTFRQ
ncbi:MAG: hypothetical protein EPO22_06020 [Dehalococcoidia bacterium]|nr:MAG: hypothetical protein EPO22_06020 [Dehalococcoidia bacterium]